MKSFLLLFSILVFIIFLLLFVLGKYSQKGYAPGLVNGNLSKCSSKPNCVCSEYIDDIDHYIAPIENHDGFEKLDISLAATSIQEMGGEIREETDEYLAATFTSSTFGFADDFEVRKDQANGILHIRSASRVGYSDGGVNFKRAELFKEIYLQKIEKRTKVVLKQQDDT